MTRVPTLLKCAMNVVRNKAKIMVTKAKQTTWLWCHIENAVSLEFYISAMFHSDSTVTSQKFGWDRPKTRFDFEKCPEQKKKSWRTPLASSYDRNRLRCSTKLSNRHIRGLSAARGDPPKWAYIECLFKSLLRVTPKMFMLITYSICFAVYLAIQRCINFYFWVNVYHL